MTGEQRMWQTVLFTAVTDALMEIKPLKKNSTGHQIRLHAQRKRLKKEADHWFRERSRKFEQVCSLAGMDPDFIHDSYVNGRIDLKALKELPNARA